MKKLLLVLASLAMIIGLCACGGGGGWGGGGDSSSELLIIRGNQTGRWGHRRERLSA
mgnify:CR=1 FL=1